MNAAWLRSDLSLHGLGRALIHGERPNHAALSVVGDGWALTTKAGSQSSSDAAVLCAVRGLPEPDESDLKWVRS